MKHLAPIFAVLAILMLLFISGCESYDSDSGGGSGFTQRDLELQRKQAERRMGR